MSRAFWDGFLRGLAQPAVIWIWAIGVPLFYVFAAAPLWWPYAVLSAVCWLVIIRDWARRRTEGRSMK